MRVLLRRPNRGTCALTARMIASMASPSSLPAGVTAGAGLSEICDPIPTTTPLRRRFDRLDQAVRDHIDQLNLAT